MYSAGTLELSKINITTYVPSARVDSPHHGDGSALPVAVVGVPGTTAPSLLLLHSNSLSSAVISTWG